MFRVRAASVSIVLFTVLASTATAQGTGSPIITNEWPHLEVSVGFTGMKGGPSGDIEREMRTLNLDDPVPARGSQEFPRTSMGLGWFGLVHVAVTQHTMIGYLASSTEQMTNGQRVSPVSLFVPISLITLFSAHQAVKTQAIIMSVRPVSWFKIGAGPAMHWRTFEISGPDTRLIGVDDTAVGWVASSELTLRLERATGAPPPAFVKVIAQYRGAGVATSEPGVLSFGRPYFIGIEPEGVSWPATPLRFSHWMVGLGFGVEF